MLLSVIIPTRNRAAHLADLLDSLAAQEPVTFDWEVIVVDNASTDDTPEVARQKAAALPITIRYAHEPNLGLHHGRHRGAKEAAGTFLGYLDDDMILAPTWIQGVTMAAQGRADAVVGRVLPQWEVQPPGWVKALASEGIDNYLGLLDLGTTARPVEPVMVLGGNAFLPRQALFELGGFHPDGVPTNLLRYRGDGETGLMVKFKQKGMRSWYDPRATAYHIISADRLTIEYICQRAYRQGISDSFTQIRAAHGLGEVPFSGHGLGTFVEKLRTIRPAQAAQTVTRKVGKALGLASFLPYHEIQEQIVQAYREGWQFHQDEVRRDPDLLTYVLKPTYLE